MRFPRLNSAMKKVHSFAAAEQGTEVTRTYLNPKLAIGSPYTLLAIIALILIVSASLVPSTSQAFDLPTNFENIEIINNLNEPDAFAFSPDGRLFISERITGRLLVAKYDSGSDSWTVNPEPFYTFNIPKNDSGEPEARRSGGLRDIAFDPDFANNGYVYAFYMQDDSLQNRVVRIKADDANPDIADAGEREDLLIQLPFNDSEASGSHNGGALEFGADGTLFITTGDGWEGEFQGDPVQSLATLTGKVLRINADGTIPTDNPFVGQASGPYQAIYALGLRNPYSMSKNDQSGKLYINEARGNNKASIYLVEAGANYGHEAGASIEIGTLVDKWADGSGGGGELITGGAWYPSDGPFPDAYHGGYFVALWGSNSSNRGQISVVASEADTAVTRFEGDVGLSTDPPVKPVITRIGPDGNLYYMLTTYQTDSGTIQMVRYTGVNTVVTPLITPNGSVSATPMQVTLSTTTVDATIHYTLDGSEPTQASPVYSEPLTISVSTLLKAKAFKDGLNPSSTGSASFTIGEDVPNVPPIADAGPDKRATVGQATSLDGSGSFDPDGDDDLLRDETWIQISGPSISISDASEEIAFFTPEVAGIYLFQLSISDGEDIATDQVTITVVAEDSCVATGLQALYTFREGNGSTITDKSGQGAALNLRITGSNTAWLPDGGLAITGAASIASTAPASKLINASQASNAFSVELWLKSANVSQDGPARIFTISADSLNRNLTIGQGKFGNNPTDVFDVRLRTSGSATDDNGEPSFTTDAGTATTNLVHFVYTRDTSGQVEITIDGNLVASGSISGDLSNWNPDYALGLANEFGSDRPWVGELHGVAFYDCAMTETEISANFAVGRFSAAPFSTQPTPTPEPTPNTGTSPVPPTPDPTDPEPTDPDPTDPDPTDPDPTDPDPTTPNTSETMQLYLPLK